MCGADCFYAYSHTIHRTLCCIPLPDILVHPEGDSFCPNLHKAQSISKTISSKQLLTCPCTRPSRSSLHGSAQAHMHANNASNTPSTSHVQTHRGEDVHKLFHNTTTLCIQKASPSTPINTRTRVSVLPGPHEVSAQPSPRLP